MTGSSLAPIVIPIVVMFGLAAWLVIVFYAGSHPHWKDRGSPAAQRAGAGPALTSGSSPPQRRDSAEPPAARGAVPRQAPAPAGKTLLGTRPRIPAGTAHR
jgi:hypothetical protein